MVHTCPGCGQESPDRSRFCGYCGKFAGICEHLASPDDVASQFHWRCVRGKLKARQGAIDEAEALLSAATALIETSDQLDLQGNGLPDFAEVRELAGAPADAAALSERAARLFERKGNVVSARRARQLAERLLSQADRAAAGGRDRLRPA